MRTTNEKYGPSAGRRFWIRVAWGLLVLAAGFLPFAAHSPYAILTSLVFGFIGVIILWDPLAHLASSPLQRLFYPSREFEKPQPPYATAEAKAKKGDYEEAIAAYQRIAAEYPEEIEPFIAMLHVAIFALHDPPRAARIYEEGMQALKTEKDRLALTRVYAAFRSTTEPKPDWQQTRTVKFEPAPRPESTQRPR